MDVDVRRAEPADAPAIHELMLEAFTPFRPEYTSLCFDATVLDAARIRRRIFEGPVWVACAGDRLLGTVSAVHDDRGLYVRGLGVHPGARRMGIGRALLQEAEAFARQEGEPGMWLSTTPFLDGSIALYEAFGFVDAPGPSDLHGTPLRSFEKALR